MTTPGGEFDQTWKIKQTCFQVKVRCSGWDSPLDLPLLHPAFPPWLQDNSVVGTVQEGKEEEHSQGFEKLWPWTEAGLCTGLSQLLFQLGPTLLRETVGSKKEDFSMRLKSMCIVSSMEFAEMEVLVEALTISMDEGRQSSAERRMRHWRHWILSDIRAQLTPTKLRRWG